MKILFLSAWYPFPADNGSKLRIYNLLRGLSANHEIHLISFTHVENPNTVHLEKFCTSVTPISWQEGKLHGIKRHIAKISTTPYSFLDTYSPDMVEAINRILDHNTIEFVIASQIKTASYGPFLRGLPAIFEEIELGVMYEQFSHASTLKEKIRYQLTWWKHKRFLEHLLQFYQSVTLASPEEKQLFHTKITTNKIKSRVVPNGVDVESYTAYHQPPQEHQIIFTGAFTFLLNYEAMVWFVGQVFPRIQEQVPDVTLVITGKHNNLPLPSEAGIHRTGFVDDIKSLIAQSTVSIAPLLTGGGTRLKILEAMALKTPVVATSKGAQGLNAIAGKECLIEDDPDEFARAVIELLSTPAKRREISEHGYALVRKKYDWQVILPLIEDMMRCTKE